MDEQNLLKRLIEAGIDGSSGAVGQTLRPTALRAKFDRSMNELAEEAPRRLPQLPLDLGQPIGDAEATLRGSDLVVLEQIGEGGMGQVLLAYQRSMRRDVALKTTKLNAKEKTQKRLLMEGLITGTLEHPGIVPVHAMGLDQNGLPVLVMKRIEGVGWDTLLENPDHEGWEGWDGTPEDRLPGHLQILAQICNAVEYAHSRDIIHRDIKPENVIIGRFGDVYLVDWGIATTPGITEETLCGTPGYMAPEMVVQEPIDARTDVYLLGATLHELLTKRKRHDSADLRGALRDAALSEAFEYPPSVPPELGALANAACHTNPDQRPTSALAIRDALKRYESHSESRTIGDEAILRLNQAKPLYAQKNLDVLKLARLERLLAEATFGLEQALKSWPGNPRAQNAKKQLDALLKQRQARTAALVREAQDHDPSVGFRERSIGISVIAGISMTTTLAVFASGVRPSPIVALVGPTFFFVVMLIVFVKFRNALSNGFTRRAALMLFGICTMVVLSRTLGLVLKQPLPVQITRDGMIIAMGLAVGSLTVFRWLGWIAALYLLAGVSAAFLPSRSPVFMGGATSLALLIAVIFSWKRAR